MYVFRSAWCYVKFVPIGCSLDTQWRVPWSASCYLGIDTNWTLLPKPTGHNKECKWLNCACTYHHVLERHLWGNGSTYMCWVSRYLECSDVQCYRSIDYHDIIFDIMIMIQYTVFIYCHICSRSNLTSSIEKWLRLYRKIMLYLCSWVQ